MSSGHTESLPVPPAANEVPVEELARLQGVRPVESVDDMAATSLVVHCDMRASPAPGYDGALPQCRTCTRSLSTTAANRACLR